jgi:hypothetical protein
MKTKLSSLARRTLLLVAALALLLLPVGHAAAQERIDAKIVGGQPALGAVSFIASIQTDDGDH